ncbi:hypothetical protein ACFXTO_047262 [Malus domestica]
MQPVISSVGIDSTVTVELAGLASSSLGIDSTASRVTGYLSKSQSKKDSRILIGRGHFISLVDEVRCYSLLGSARCTPS